MKGLLVRVGADLTKAGGRWNGPVNPSHGGFVYVAIPETHELRDGLNKPYEAIRSTLDGFGHPLPAHLHNHDMHLDPDFEHLTYGDRGERGKQLVAKLAPGDLLVFYAGLRSVQQRRPLVYALIGLFVVDEFVRAPEVPLPRWHENAHTRRIGSDEDDVIVRARPKVSGRLERCIPVGDYRERAYRVWPELEQEWGGLCVRNGYLQRSARLPEFRDASRFHQWFLAQGVGLVQRNN